MKPATRISGLTWFLVAIGLALRVAGLAFNGTHDLDQLVLGWGATVASRGIGHTPIVIYGLFSYALHGLAFSAATYSPRFWWAPQKFLEVVSEAGIFLALMSLLPPNRRSFALWFYWLNPFFIVSGGWLGFWDGPHTLSALLAVLALRRWGDNNRGWIIAGACLAVGALFKPQGLIYFAMPVGVYLLIDTIFRLRPSRIAFAIVGGLSVFIMSALFLVLAGGHAIGILRNYALGDVMPNLCNSCISIWRPVTRALQLILGQSGALYELVLPQTLSRVADRLILAITVFTICIFCLLASGAGGGARDDEATTRSRLVRLFRLVGIVAIALCMIGLVHKSDPSMHSTLVAGRYSRRYFLLVMTSGVLGVLLATFGRQASALIVRAHAWSAARAPRDVPQYVPVFLAMTFGALAVPQLATRAHMNHTYGALVLLVPFAAINATIFRAWLASTAIHFYGYLSAYGIGSPSALPERDISGYPEVARRMVASIDAGSHPWLFSIQRDASAIIHRVMPLEPVLSVLAVVQFACALIIMRELIRRGAEFPRTEK